MKSNSNLVKVRCKGRRFLFTVPEESKNISRSVAVYGLLTDKARSVLNLLSDGRIL